ncbi:MAG: ABC transporter permease [Patulibacter sp.]
MNHLRQQFRIVAAFFKKDFATSLTYRTAFVTAFFTPVWGLITFYFMSRVVGTSETVGDADGYFRFLVIGIALGDIMRVAVASPAASARRDQVQGTLETMFAQPIPPTTMVMSWVAYPLFQSGLRVLITLLVAWPLGFELPHADLFAFVAVLVATSLAFVAIGMVSAALVVAFQQGTSMVALVMALLAMLSGAVFPVDVLPPALRIIADVSPMRYAFDAARAAAVEGRDVFAIGGELLSLLAFAAVLVPLGVLAINRAARLAKQRGRLSTF